MLWFSAVVRPFALVYATWVGVMHYKNPSKSSLIKIFLFLTVAWTPYGLSKFINGDLGGLLLPVFAPLFWCPVVLLVSWIIHKISKAFGKPTIKIESGFDVTSQKIIPISKPITKLREAYEKLPERPVLERYKNIDPRITITVDGKYLVDGEIFGTAYSAEAHLSRINASLSKNPQKYAMSATVYAVNTSSKRIFEFKMNEDGQYNFDGYNTISHTVLSESAEWSVFASLPEATQYKKKITNIEVQTKNAIRLKASQEAKASELVLIKQHKYLLKEFRLRTLNIPTDHLKQAMFAVTGNKQFLKKLYDPKKDDMIFTYISGEELEELFGVLK